MTVFAILIISDHLWQGDARASQSIFLFIFIFIVAFTAMNLWIIDEKNRKWNLPLIQQALNDWYMVSCLVLISKKQMQFHPSGRHENNQYN